MSQITAQQLLSHIHSRQSNGSLSLPVPSQQQLEQCISAAISAPDHRRLQPWRFQVIQGDALYAFGELMYQSAVEFGVTAPAKLDKIKTNALRAPMILLCTMHYQDHPNVPHYEQVLSCGSAVQNILLMLQAQGFSSVWRTGEIAINPIFKENLGLEKADEVIAIVYIGSSNIELPARQNPTNTDLNRFLSHWNGSTQATNSQ